MALYGEYPNGSLALFVIKAAPFTQDHTGGSTGSSSNKVPTGNVISTEKTFLPAFGHWPVVRITELTGTLCMAYNSSVHPTTPFFLMFGRQTRMPIYVAFGLPHSDVATSHSDFAHQLRKRLEDAYQEVRETLGHTLNHQKELSDKKVHGDPFQPGDLVWLHSPVRPKGCPRKFHRPWTGPYRIVKKLSATAYHLQGVTAQRHRPVIHINRLKPCPEDIRLPCTIAETTTKPQSCCR